MVVCHQEGCKVKLLEEFGYIWAVGARVEGQIVNSNPISICSQIRFPIFGNGASVLYTLREIY